MKLARQTLLVLFGVAHLSGCVSYKAIPNAGTATGSGSLDEQISPGDRLRLRLRDGSVVNLDVISIDREQIVGDRATIPLTDIKGVERRKSNVLGTTLLVGGAVLLFGIYKAADGLADGFGDLIDGE
jgi:hypothetical protein